MFPPFAWLPRATPGAAARLRQAHPKRALRKKGVVMPDTVGTQIVIEGRQGNWFFALVSWLVRLAISLAILAALGYGFLFYTDTGEDIRDRYDRKVQETKNYMDAAMTNIRFYIAQNGRPPATIDEINDFTVHRLTHPFTQYVFEGEPLPFFQRNDGFGHKFRYKLDESERKVRIVSYGPLGIIGLMNITTEMAY